MPRIRVLPSDLSNKIAAGEVIERPASVVKELIENSIDAGSEDIRIEALHGGKRLIKVTDDGSGMDREDALLCFERHATSKLSDEADLFEIRTLGFRGEALPSIASVAKVRLITGVKGASSGVSLEIKGGRLGEVRDAPFSGTSLEVKDLFFNTPARKKFMKANSTEVFHIIDTVTKAAISHYPISFRLSIDHREAFLLPKASGVRERLLQIYGEEFLGGLQEINEKCDDMEIRAFLSKSGNYRSSKAYQFVFINDRTVRDPALSHAVYKAYEGILPHDKHPVFFLFLGIHPGNVDFNVHPAKREVRFADRERVYAFVRSMTRTAVKDERHKYTGGFAPALSPVTKDGADGVFTPSAYRPGEAVTVIAENTEFEYKPAPPSLYLGDTFTAVSGKGGFTVVDHHAAHERILYEKLLRKIELVSHPLLFPEQVRLAPKEYRILLDNKDLMSEFGILIDDFGHNTVVVRTVPDDLRDADITGILSDAAAAILEGVHPGKTIRETLAASIACHNSVRGKAVLDREEIFRLLGDLEKAEFPDQCPHGRPTRIFFSLDQLKKMFKRK